MKLHSDNTQQYQTVTGYDASGVEINAQRFNFSLTVMPEVPPRPWNVTRFEDLSAAHFEEIAKAFEEAKKKLEDAGAKVELK